MENLSQLYKDLELADEINPKNTDYCLPIKFDNSFSSQEEKFIKAERKIISLMFFNGKLIYRIPHMEPEFYTFLNPDELEYFKNRIQIVENEFIAIRYLMVLWKSTKHNKFSKQAFDKLYKILSIKLDDKNESFHDLNELLLICRSIVEKTKYRIDDYMGLVRKIKMRIKNTNEYFSFLQQLFENKLIPSETVKELIQDYERHIQIGVNSYHTLLANEYKFSALLQKAKLDLKPFYRLLAENEKSLIEHKDQGDIVLLELLRKKAKYEKLAGEIEKSEKTLEELTKSKINLKLNKVSFRLSSDENKELFLLWEIIDQTSTQLANLNSEYILGYFSSDFANLHSVTTEKGRIPILSESFSTIYFDINNNPNREQRKSNLSDNIGIYYNFIFKPIFENTLRKGILNGHLRVDNFLDYFNKTWYNKKFNYTKDGFEIKESWVDQLRPGLFNFFSLFEYNTLHDDLETNNYILCTDSLTLKFEGILRDFIRFLGGSTVKTRKDQTDEILLEEMLEHKMITNHLDAAEIEFFKYVFTSQGMNVRNNVAHGFYKVSDYSFRKISYILLCLLRMCRFSLDEK